MSKLLILFCILFFSACELQDYEPDKDYDYQYLVNGSCNSNNTIIFFQSGKCLKCENGYWSEKYNCEMVCE
jgi:hypothetical protein